MQAMTMDSPLLFDQVEYLARNKDQMLLTALGFETDLNGDVRCPCPIHGGDNPTGFCYNSKSQTWHCWTRKCHDSYGVTLVGLTKAIKKFETDEETFQYILEVCGNGFIPDEELLKLQKFIKTNIRKSKIENPVLDKAFIDPFPYLVNGMPESNITAHTCKEYNIRLAGNINHALKNRILFPIIDENNKFVGISGRTTNDSKSKWYHYPPSLRIGKLLWPLTQFKEYCYLHGCKNIKAILVEGPKDAIKLHQEGYKNTVCLFGTSCTNDQIRLLIKYGVSNVLVFLDADEAGKKAAKGLFSKLSLYFNVRVVEGHDKDPDELSVNELKRLLND